MYEGTADEYITFNYSDERPAMRADDTDELDETSVQVHLFTRNNPQQAKKDIRRLLQSGRIYNYEHTGILRNGHEI